MHASRLSFERATSDGGLELRCLGGFPGPYIKPMLESVGYQGVWDLVNRSFRLATSSNLNYVIIELDR